MKLYHPEIDLEWEIREIDCPRKHCKGEITRFYVGFNNEVRYTVYKNYIGCRLTGQKHESKWYEIIERKEDDSV